MKHRNLAAVVLLTIITLGIYWIVWLVMTTREMRKLGAKIPNCFLMVIPIVQYYWFWRYSEGVNKVTKGKWATGLVFLLFILLGIGGQILSQLAFNEDVSATPQSTDNGANGVPSQPSGQATTSIPTAGVAAGVGAATVVNPNAESSNDSVASAPEETTTVASAPEAPASESSEETQSPEPTMPAVESTAPETTESPVAETPAETPAEPVEAPTEPATSTEPTSSPEVAPAPESSDPTAPSPMA